MGLLENLRDTARKTAIINEEFKSLHILRAGQELGWAQVTLSGLRREEHIAEEGGVRKKRLCKTPHTSPQRH